MITVSNKKFTVFTGDILAVLVSVQADGSMAAIDPALQSYLARATTAGDFTAKIDETLMVYPDKDLPCKRLLFIGLGDKEKGREEIRKAGGIIGKKSLEFKAESLAAIWYGIDMGMKELGECLTEGVLLGQYRFTRYKKSKDDDKDVFLKKITLFPQELGAECRKGVRLAEVAARAGKTARDMANEPGNNWTAEEFAVFARSLSEKFPLKCTVYSHRDLRRLKMGGVLAVNQGSENGPRMVILEYRCAQKKADTLLLVGKGLTFDSGGISLKPSAGMEDMKYDMCGGAAVMAAMAAIGEEKPAGVNVVGIVPATDNMPGAAAVKPGDIITSYSGKTVEVINTDAEGRLILMDALAYGIKKYKPAAIVDLATLTGAVIIGLGHHYSGLLSNNDILAEKIVAAGERSGEPAWRLPLGAEYKKQLKSEVADLKNIGGKPAGTITAAAFLEEFVGDTPWAHLDIAGTAWGFTEKSYIPKGPSGIAARTLIDLVRNWS
ncbi:MAG: leucyl aminopeptidase [Thermodesulfobacteriota bacterium]